MSATVSRIHMSLVVMERQRENAQIVRPFAITVFTQKGVANYLQDAVYHATAALRDTMRRVVVVFPQVSVQPVHHAKMETIRLDVPVHLLASAICAVLDASTGRMPAVARVRLRALASRVQSVVGCLTWLGAGARLKVTAQDAWPDALCSNTR